MSLSPEPLPPELLEHEADLLVFATGQMRPWLRPHLDPADLVQQTLFEVWRARAGVDTRSAKAVRSYLFTALTRNLIDAVRKYTPEGRDVSPDALAESSRRMAGWIEAPDTAPSQRAERNERYARLAGALAKLPEAQRIAVEMRYLLGMRVGEIARILNRSEGAVSLLLYRAVTALRDLLTESGA